MVEVIYKRKHFHLKEYELSSEEMRPLMMEKLKKNLGSFKTIKALRERMVKDADALEAVFAMKVVKWWTEQEQIKFIDTLSEDEIGILEAEACIHD